MIDAVISPILCIQISMSVHWCPTSVLMGCVKTCWQVTGVYVTQATRWTEPERCAEVSNWYTYTLLYKMITDNVETGLQKLGLCAPYSTCIDDISQQELKKILNYSHILSQHVKFQVNQKSLQKCWHIMFSWKMCWGKMLVMWTSLLCR